MSQLLALTSAALYGFADFAGGLASRTTPTWTVVAWSQVFGLPILAVGLLVVDAPTVTRADLAYGATAGIIGLAGIAALYQALARGSMAVVSPITGALVAVIPVVVGLWVGETLTSAQWIGVVLAVVAAVWFAAFFVVLDQTSIDAGLWPLVAARTVATPTAFVVAALTGSNLRPSRSSLPTIAIAGCFDMAANIAILLALQSGPLGTGSVLSSLYPAFTVLAAVVVISETPSRVQWLGVALALAAALLLSL